MDNNKLTKTDILTEKVYALLLEHGKLTGALQKKDISVWGYSNPVETTFITVEDAISFFRRFEGLDELNLSPGQFTVFANAICFEVELVVIPKK